MKRIQLSEGIYLNIINSDKFKTDYLDINIVFPLKQSTASLAALLPQVLKRGSENYPTMADITKRFDYLYSTVFSTNNFKRGEAQVLNFSIDFLRDSLVPAGSDLMQGVFDTLYDILFRPLLCDGAFKPEYVESEKKNLIDSINALINNKNAYAMKKCHEAMCAGSDYAVNAGGDVDVVNTITPAQLYSFYKELMAHSMFEIFYTGMAQDDVITACVKQLMSAVERGSVVPVSTEKFVRTRENVTEITEEMEVAQGKLILGFSSDHTVCDEDYTAYSLFNELYGGSPTSKLFENVREKLSLCYYCRSIPDAHKGILTVASGIEVENRDKALNEILAQLKAAADGIISDEELISAKKSLINGYRELFDGGNSLHIWYLARLIAGSTKTVEQVIEEIETVTKEDIARCAAATKLDTVFFLKGTLADGGEENE